MPADTFQLKRGTTAKVSAYLPAIGEPVYNTDTKALTIGDGVTLGGVAPTPTNANLVALSGLTGAADRLAYFTGVGAMSLTNLTPLARTFLATTTQATARTAILAAASGVNTDITSLGPITFTGGNVNAVPATVASAATASVGAANSDTVLITGTTTITSFGTATVGTRRRLLISGVLTITNNANILIPGGANILTAVGDVVDVENTSAGVWRVTAFEPVSGGASITTNANGTSIRYRDGTQVCHGVLTIGSVAITTVTGSIFASASQAGITFPQAFIAAPTYLADCISTNATAWFGRAAIATTTNGPAYFIFAPASASQTITLSYTAHGRWF